MTKPECSKDSRNKEFQLKEESESESKFQTAKFLFADFVGENSEINRDDEDSEVIKVEIEKSEGNYEPSLKKSKENSTSKKYTPKYRKEWEFKPEFKSWLSESIHGNTYFYCKFCKKDYRCGSSEIQKHMSSKKHALSSALPAFKREIFNFRGLLCPVFTPFLNVHRTIPDINVKVIKKYANFLNACTIRGVLINDLVGEGMSMTVKERMEVTDAWIEACEQNNQFLMVQIGGAPFKDVVELATHAHRRQVGAVVVLPDLYNKPRTHLDLIKYLKLLSQFTKNIPLLYHHNPKFSHVEINITSFLLDIIGEIDSFVGLIFTTNNIQESGAAMNINREKFTVFIGTDEAILPAAASGFTCIMSISLNFLPKLVESICENVRNGNIKKAQSCQKLLNQTIDIVLKEGDTLAAFKAATDIITSMCGNTTREPIQSLWEGTIKKLRVQLKELGIM